MKIWQIKIMAKTERNAIKYIDLMKNSFYLAVKYKQPMNFINASDKGEKLEVKLINDKNKK